MAYTLPSTWDALEAAGWQFSNRTRCSGCGRTIEWWLSPAGRKSPLEKAAEAGGRYLSHFAICPKADSFRRKQVKQEVQAEKPKAEPKKKREPVLQKRLFR